MIYIHVPFCRSFCTYCGFYSEVAGPGKDAEIFNSYVDAIVAEAAERRDEIAATLDTNTLYIGGGTPSVLPLSLLRRIVEALPYGPYEEFTVEVNPEDIVEKGLEYAEGLKNLGVTRVSMGVQSFDDCTLRWMNRRHDSARAREAFGILRRAGFDNISIDLIFGISPSAGNRVPGEARETGANLWRETVRQAVDLGPQHISAYQLSIEEGSALEKLISTGRYNEASEEECREQYDILCAELARAGYNHYEISNFAIPGREARHNSAYWSRVPYVGLGPGAHSFDGARRRWNSEIDDHGTCAGACAYVSASEELSPEDARVERIMLTLRCAKGAEATWLRSACGPERVDRLISEGALVETGTIIRIPESRFFVSDDIIRVLL